MGTTVHGLVESIGTITMIRSSNKHFFLCTTTINDNDSLEGSMFLGKPDRWQSHSSHCYWIIVWINQTHVLFRMTSKSYKLGLWSQTCPWWSIDCRLSMSMRWTSVVHVSICHSWTITSSGRGGGHLWVPAPDWCLPTDGHWALTGVVTLHQSHSSA